MLPQLAVAIERAEKSDKNTESPATGKDKSTARTTENAIPLIARNKTESRDTPVKATPQYWVIMSAPAMKVAPGKTAYVALQRGSPSKDELFAKLQATEK